MDKMYPRAEVFAEVVDDGGAPVWEVHLVMAPMEARIHKRRVRTWIGDYNDWGWAINEANDAVKKERGTNVWLPRSSG